MAALYGMYLTFFIFKEEGDMAALYRMYRTSFMF